MTSRGDESDRPESGSEEGEEFHLSTAAEHELKRLATHPVEEAHRLQEDVREGEKASGLLVLMGEVSIVVWLLAVLLMVAVFLIAYFVAS